MRRKSFENRDGKGSEKLLGGFLKEKKIRVRVILFGSRAKGNFGPHSDVDLAIDSKEDLVDIIELSKASKVLKKGIFTKLLHNMMSHLLSSFGA